MIARAVLAMLIALLTVGPAGAADFDPFAAAGIDGEPGAAVPRDLPFTDETGRSVTPARYLGERPVLLAPVYYTCPNVCGVTLGNLFHALAKLDLKAGRDFEVVAYSFRPDEGPAEAAAEKRELLMRHPRAAGNGGVHFLTGEEDAARALSDAVGFRYAWDPRIEQFAHAAGVAVLTPDGRLARWLYGVDLRPLDLRLALAEAGRGRTAPGFADRLLLLCYHYNPVTGRYGGLIQGGLRAGAALTVGTLVLFVAWTLIREARRRRERRHV